MAERPAPDGDDGFVTVQFAVATAFALLMFVLLANLVLAQYARASLRSAVDEGARAASRAASDGDAHARCLARVDDAMADLLGGSLLASRARSCTIGADRVAASASGTVAAWLPLYPAMPIDATTTVVREVAP